MVPLDLVVHLQIFGPWPDYLLADAAVANPLPGRSGRQ
jgi:hypothetical protein